MVTRCPYFKATDLRLTSEWKDDTAPGKSFHMISAVNGRVQVGNDERSTVLLPGESAVIPACFGSYAVLPLDGGETTVLKTTL